MEKINVRDIEVLVDNKTVLIKENILPDGPLNYNLKFICESHPDVSLDFNADYNMAYLSGVYIMKDIEKDIYYRISKSFQDPTYSSKKDLEMVALLQSKQSNIKLSEFPTGIVTMNGRVIGQEIPYYKNSQNLYDFASKENEYIKPTTIYIQILNILKELYENGIYYKDVHSGNFCILDSNIENEKLVKIIDFDPNYISDKKETAEKIAINNFCHLINNINTLFGLNDDLELEFCDTFEEIEKQIYEMDKKRGKRL